MPISSLVDSVELSHDRFPRLRAGGVAMAAGHPGRRNRHEGREE